MSYCSGFVERCRLSLTPGLSQIYAKFSCPETCHGAYNILSVMITKNYNLKIYGKINTIVDKKKFNPGIAWNVFRD